MKMNQSLYDQVSNSKANLDKDKQEKQQLKKQKDEIEKDYKTRYMENLFAQIDKRITQLNFQANIYKKQKKLYSIYGAAPNAHN